MAGALDSFGERGQLLFNLEALLEYNKGQKSMHADQGSLFGGDASHITLRPAEPMSDDDRLVMEKEILGVYVTGHPLDPFKERFAKFKKRPLQISNIGLLINHQPFKLMEHGRVRRI